MQTKTKKYSIACALIYDGLESVSQTTQWRIK